MPAYWLKPFGTTDPPRKTPEDWTRGVALERFHFMTGPPNPKRPPKMGKGDLVLFHAVIHVRLYAAAEILDNPHWAEDDMWGLRFPWVYPVKAKAWVPLVSDGIRTTDIAPTKTINRIKTGAAFAELTKEPYETMLNALLARPTVVVAED